MAHRLGTVVKHVRYLSIGNVVGLDDKIHDYWEIDAEGCVVRSVVIRPDGTRLKYGPLHMADQFGALPEGKITDSMLADRSFGTITAIDQKAFEIVWAAEAENV